MVYVDEIRKYGYGPRCFRGGASHMTADTEEELHEMASAIGLKREWYQNKGGTPHYDLTPTKRQKAFNLGATFKPAREQAKERLRAKGLLPQEA